MSDNLDTAVIRWDCGFCGARAGTWCHVRHDVSVRATYLHSRRGYALRKLLREEFWRGREYERSAAELRALRAAQDADPERERMRAEAS